MYVAVVVVWCCVHAYLWVGMCGELSHSLTCDMLRIN